MIPTVSRLMRLLRLLRLLPVALTATVVLGTGSGCALIPQFGEPPVTQPVVAAPDTMRARVPDPDLWPTATENEEKPIDSVKQATKPKTTTPPKTKPPEEPPAEVDTAPADSVQVDVVPAVTVSPPSQKLEEIETETLASLKEAKQLIDAVDPGMLDSAGQDELRIVRGFVSQAEDALARQDLQAAAGLARKARLLAVELTSR